MESFIIDFQVKCCIMGRDLKIRLSGRSSVEISLCRQLKKEFVKKFGPGAN
jgi:hypothetical protein